MLYRMIYAIINHNLLLFVNNVEIKRTSVIEYLGIFIDEMLNWKTHTGSLIKKISNFIGSIYRKRSLIGLPYVCRRNLCFALIHSILIYGIEVFCSAQKTLLSSIMISCNRVLRVGLMQEQLTAILSSLRIVGYINFNAMSIHNIFRFAILNLM